MFELALDYILFPALAGFMVVGPVLAIGLYEKSRRIADGVPVTLAGMVFVRSRSGGQILFTGVLLSLLMLLRSEEHTSELQSLMRISYAVFCFKKKNTTT